LFSYSHIYIFVIFVFSLHFTYIGDNVSFKCGGRDLGCVLICFVFFFLKKKKYLLFVFWFSIIFGCVCHEHGSIKLGKFIT
jgi:hypothetical protein